MIQHSVVTLLLSIILHNIYTDSISNTKTQLKDNLSSKLEYFKTYHGEMRWQVVQPPWITAAIKVIYFLRTIKAIFHETSKAKIIDLY